MRTRRPPLLTAALVGAALLAGCAGDDVDGVDAELEELDDDSGDGEPVDPDAEADADPDAEADADEATDADGDDGLQVTIRDNSFNPGSLDVAVGDTVTWTHDGSLGHNVTADDFESGGLSGGDVFEFTFEEAGTVAYACTIHRGMTGEIVVS
jgi:plastocyanin